MIYRPVSFTSNPRKTMKQILLDAVSGHMKDEKVTGNSVYQGQKKSEWSDCFFFNEMTVVDKGTVAGDVYFDFSKAFGVAFNRQISEMLSC